MREFRYKTEYSKLLTPEVVALLAQIHEYRGQQNLFIEAKADVLTELLEISKIQSAEGSNRIEGIMTTEDRLKMIVRDKTIPKTLSEREIAGYRDVLTIIHENYDYIPIQPGAILQLHRDLYRYNGTTGGIYRSSDNIIPDAMNSLCEAFQEALQDEAIDDLLLIPMLILDFLCIHPFDDGNERMSRLLTLLGLYRSGYIVCKYISIEKIIADSKESYFEAIQNSSVSWHDGANDYLPYVRYFLGVLVAAYRDFSDRVVQLTNRSLNKMQRVREIIRSTSGRITKTEIMRQCPDISQITIQRSLKELIDKGEILKIGGGRYTSYAWNWEC